MARIAIVGAGPAGSSAGWHLARRGHAVTLIDRAAFPRDKTCGDWLTPGALAELDRLGLDGAALDRLAPGHAVVRATLLAGPSGRPLRVAPPGPAGRCVARRLLDDLVRRRALDAGCVPDRQAVRDARALVSRFDVVVDARGAYAGGANAVALRAYWDVPRARVPVGDADCVQLRADARIRRGYGWIFPVETRADLVRFNVGVGMWADRATRGVTIAEYFARFVATDPAARRLRDAAAATARPVGYHTALAGWRNRVAGDGVLRIGDAANLADPMTGDGIGNALASGRMAAEAIDACPDAAQAAARWQTRHDAELAPSFRAALLMRAALSTAVAKDAATRVLAAWPWLERRVSSALFGAVPYASLLPFAREAPGPAAGGPRNPQ